MSKSLIVFQRAAITLLRQCQVEIGNPLGLSFEESFDSADLDRDFRRMGLDAMQQQELVVVPPTKRRKLHTETDILEEVTTNLYTLLGSQSAIDLGGLSQVAE